MSAGRVRREWAVCLLGGLALAVSPIVADYGAIAEKFGAEAVRYCNEKCPFQNRTEDVHFDLSCGPKCKIKQCTLGCSLWREGLERSCQAACNVTSDAVLSKELYCVMGCNEALNMYFQKLRELIGRPPAPALVADSLTANSLSLVWEPAGSLGNLSCLVQWRYEDLAATWQYYANSSWSDRSIVSVQDLQPYTKYRFRVAIFLSEAAGRGGEPVISEPSLVMSTLAKGKPSSQPTALRATALDSHRISITWEPGPFPNGPIISYVLRLASTTSRSNTVIKDIPASNNTLFYMFQNLMAAQEYLVFVSMRNAEGEGPEASVTVSTMPLIKGGPSQQPILILGGMHNVLAAPAYDILESEPIELFSTDDIVTGVALDFSNDLLFVSDTSGSVYRSSLSNKQLAQAILTPDTIPYRPLDLSVDWLNKHIYVLGEVHYKSGDSISSTNVPQWEILRCDYNGKNHLVALSGFVSKPIHIEVDPFNGYLFWALQGVDRGGLYRLDLANISNGVRRDVSPDLILRDSYLGAFIVDHANFRLLVSHLRRNTVLSVSLDGREISDFRNNTQKPMFHSVTSMAFAGGLFYWTNGEEMLTEEYHNGTNSYFHNEYPLSPKTNIIKKVLVALRSSQPIPVAVNPPIKVQSVMGITRAKIQWLPPHLLGHQGIGAWQNWRYHIHITEADSGFTLKFSDVIQRNYIVSNLKEDTKYIIKTAAVTESGIGPWSSEFIGRTLTSSPDALYSTILWSGKEGLIQTDLTGDNALVLVHKSHLKDLHITDISWYHDRLYLVTNASTVLWYNTTSHDKGWMSNMHNVGSLAVDWVGKRLYWSSPKQQLITRGNLEGGNREPVPIVTVAKELKIDSIQAYIYWNTGHAIEGARLNGEHKITYYPAQLFSGKQVMGLTADLDKKWLYWLVRGYDGSELHRAPTADRIPASGEIQISGSLVSSLVGTSPMGPLCYFSGRLVWLRDEARAVISDLAGRYTADLRGTRAANVHMIAVINPTLHNDSANLVAIPEAIDSSSIQITGWWNKFNISWDPVIKVNHGKVFYDINVEFDSTPAEKLKIERTTEVPYLVVEAAPAGLQPYSGAEVSVRAHTHWGGGGAGRRRVRTPPAAPSEPHAPILYTLPPTSSSEHKSIVFRWKRPRQENGLLGGYQVVCWYSEDGEEHDVCREDLSADSTEYILKTNSTVARYYFKVRGFTEAGHGPYSETVSILSTEVNPIPRIATSSEDSIKVVDLDMGVTQTIPKSTGIPVDFTVSLHESNVFWANNLGEIFVSGINRFEVVKLLSINGSVYSLAVDWIARVLYWSQMVTIGDATMHAIYRYDLNTVDLNSTTYFKLLEVNSYEIVITRNQPIYNLQVAPLKRSLFWYEEGSYPGLGVIMSSKTDGTDIRTFFNTTYNQLATRNDCNCPEMPQVAKSFAIDMTEKDLALYWSDPWINQIVAADVKGCKCRAVVQNNNENNYGLLPTSISVDSKNIFWYNSTEKLLYYTNKHEESALSIIKTPYIYEISALDLMTQPWPPENCLVPKPTNLEVDVVSVTSRTMSLKLKGAEKISSCVDWDFDIATPIYTIFYRPSKLAEELCDRNKCSYVTTSDDFVVLQHLNSFTNYSMYVEVTNFFDKSNQPERAKSNPIIARTDAEAPSAIKNVSVRVLSPMLAQVLWLAEPGLTYELHYRIESSDHLQEYNMLTVSELSIESIHRTSANMTNLLPNTSYIVWVRARSPHSAEHTDSQALQLHTKPLPKPLVVHQTFPEEILVNWTDANLKVHQAAIEYSAAAGVGDGRWRTCAVVSAQGVWAARNLSPRTRYRFRLRLRYVAGAPVFYWPSDDRFTYETLADKPGAPGAAKIEAVGDRVLRVWWSEADPRGAKVTSYLVWGRPAKRSPDEQNNTLQNISEVFPQETQKKVDVNVKNYILKEGLELLHNGSDYYWLITDGVRRGSYVLYVQAANSHGWSALSEPSELSLDELAHARRDHTTVILVIALCLLATIAISVLASFTYIYKRRGHKKAILDRPLPLRLPPRGPDLELANLRELPRSRGGVIQQSTNILYNNGVLHTPTDAEIAMLPHIRRDQITLTKFLGSGAFGEVFEGIAKDLDSKSEDTKVAVKTLRKGATDNEKTEFLQEALLMSNFKHEHILSLLGVCLDNDPNFIIMELMEGGDLLSYLRTKRPFLNTPDALTLLDLLGMCIDVTRGCRYLEEMRFVHRDLAARNCLVSIKPRRLVKIGDFGLARDIYKNDYYRKEGEGLLPVRWMAVECLVDGVFSCQSDVWAWAVLCWEVLSLGHQPYPAMTNHQVLAFVRSGGTPNRPPNCPSVLYELLQKCWSYNPEERPTFVECLEILEDLRSKTSPNIRLTVAAASTHQYLTILRDAGAVTNHTYLLDENANACLDEEYPDEMESSRQLEPRPKYLELMYDSDSPTQPSIDGYEVPRSGFYASPARHSIIGVAPNRLLRPQPLNRASSLRTNMRPQNATIVPHRNGLVKRSSLCEGVGQRLILDDIPQYTQYKSNNLVSSDNGCHIHKTPF